jgi:hypothetical protein
MEPGKEFIQPMGIPPPLHVGLSESKRSLGEDTIVEFIIVNQDIPRLRSIDADPGFFEQPLNNLP